MSTRTTWGGLRFGARVVVDSSPFIYVLEGNELFAHKFVPMFQAARLGELRISISSMVLAEVLTGPLKAGNLELATRFEAALMAFDVLPMTASIASRAAQMRATHRLKLADAIQIATAIDAGADAFVTHDRDFSSVKAIAVLYG